jgi:hypothetical protein
MKIGEFLSEISVTPTEYLRQENIPVEYKKLKNGGASITRLPDGTWVKVTVDKRYQQNKEVKYEMIWHEVGHKIDEARYVRVGRDKSNVRAKITSGKYSTENADLLRRNMDFIKKNSRWDGFIYKSKTQDGKSKEYSFKGTQEVKDSDLPEYIKVQFINHIARALIQQERYREQLIELFAEGFSQYKMKTELMKAEAPELFEFFKGVDDSL